MVNVYTTCFAVFKLETSNFINSLQSFSIELKILFSKNPDRFNNSSQYKVSSASFKAKFNFN